MKPVGVRAVGIKKMEDDWSHIDYVDKGTGKFYRIYKFKNKPCKSVYLKSRFSEHLAGYALIEKDIRSALIWLRKIKDLVGDLDEKKDGAFKVARDREIYSIVKGLFVASLTFYGKGFSKCDGRPVKLERIQLDEKFTEIHDIAMSYRHNFAAHSGAKRLEFASVALVIPAKVKYGKDLPMNLYTEINQPDLLWHGNGGEVGFIQLFEHVQAVVKGKIKWLTEKIYNEEVLPKGSAHFFK
ncbi:hypothetical protein [Pseudomonas sivasensis]|uniref:Uncharacterized protein n=1 Tax=Pseudomonas sivasensis TaxID=1880678 RepID=A0ABW8DX40_9PSED